MCEGDVEGNLMGKGEVGSSVAGIKLWRLLLLDGPAPVLFECLCLLCAIALLHCHM